MTNKKPVPVTVVMAIACLVGTVCQHVAIQTHARFVQETTLLRDQIASLRFTDGCADLKRLERTPDVRVSCSSTAEVVRETSRYADSRYSKLSTARNYLIRFTGDSRTDVEVVSKHSITGDGMLFVWRGHPIGFLPEAGGRFLFLGYLPGQSPFLNISRFVSIFFLGLSLIVAVRDWNNRLPAKSLRRDKVEYARRKQTNTEHSVFLFTALVMNLLICLMRVDLGLFLPRK